MKRGWLEFEDPGRSVKPLKKISIDMYIYIYTRIYMISIHVSLYVRMINCDASPISRVGLIPIV